MSLNDKPVISNLDADNLAYIEGSGALIIDQGTAASITDIDSIDFDGGTLTISIVSGLTSSEDITAIRNQGTAGREIGISGSDVTYGGTITRRPRREPLVSQSSTEMAARARRQRWISR